MSYKAANAFKTFYLLKVAFKKVLKKNLSAQGYIELSYKIKVFNSYLSFLCYMSLTRDTATPDLHDLCIKL